MSSVPKFKDTLPAKTAESILKMGQSIWKGFWNMASFNKNPRLIQKIGTHSGVFHCDEALACFMLKQLPVYEDAVIIRSRDPEVLDTCDIVIDVGAEYNHKTRRYDHHQKGFEHTLSTIRPDLSQNKTIKLSSAGLIYAHYGIEIIENLLKKNEIVVTSDGIEKIFLHVYDGFVEEIDAIDNGIPMYVEGQPRYRINTHLSARVHRLNPEGYESDHEVIQNCFNKAVNLTGEEFTQFVYDAAQTWWPARTVVKQAIEKRKLVHPSGEIILLLERCPWKDHLHSIEKEMGIEEQIKFCVFCDAKASWRVQAIPIEPGSFICRVFLHKDWRGVRDEKLSEVAGIENCVFCHATGFIGGNKTKEGAIQMAVKSLEASQINKD